MHAPLKHGNIYSKAIGLALTDPEGFDMSEIVGAFSKKRIGATYSFVGHNLLTESGLLKG